MATVLALVVDPPPGVLKGLANGPDGVVRKEIGAGVVVGGIAAVGGVGVGLAGRSVLLHDMPRMSEVKHSK